MAFMAIIGDLGLLFYILLGFKQQEIPPELFFQQFGFLSFQHGMLVAVINRDSPNQGLSLCTESFVGVRVQS